MSTPAEQVWESQGQQQHTYFLQLHAERRAWLRKTKEALWFKWDGGCAFCRCDLPANRMTIDHICPRRSGGVDDLYNLRPLCKTCHSDLNTHNQSVGSLLLSRWMAA